MDGVPLPSQISLFYEEVIRNFYIKIFFGCPEKLTSLLLPAFAARSVSLTHTHRTEIRSGADGELWWRGLQSGRADKLIG
jgi:hypothetical protein